MIWWLTGTLVGVMLALTFGIAAVIRTIGDDDPWEDEDNETE